MAQGNKSLRFFSRNTNTLSPQKVLASMAVAPKSRLITPKVVVSVCSPKTSVWGHRLLLDCEYCGGEGNLSASHLGTSEGNKPN